ncbi:DUF2063 domain-containing protein [Roseovarius sp. M141]|uniref:HvfC/BufC N-terminal domain-containing protein n=1 Tax=Roseovarius sp. M141 TaxID=2583806 RepID=UPI0020CC631E|nr:DNA-binding domain-containing protein [Roseovarius sp. M141]
MAAHHDLTRHFDMGLKTGAVPEGATARDPAETARRFAVYQNNVAHSLTEALGARFPVIRRLVGDEFFGAMARVYAESSRPRTPVLIDWGDDFAAFLAAFEPLAGYPYMRDVARIEWVRGRAYHAADSAPLDPVAFAQANPSDLVLRFHPSVQVLRLKTPAVSIWLANQPGSESGRALPQGGEIGLVLRDQKFRVPVLAICEGDAIFVEHLSTGATLQVAAELANWADTDHDPQPILIRLMQAGAFIKREGT